MEKNDLAIGEYHVCAKEACVVESGQGMLLSELLGKDGIEDPSIEAAVDRIIEPNQHILSTVVETTIDD